VHRPSDAPLADELASATANTTPINAINPAKRFMFLSPLFANQ
jgi:hypothetical protein